MRIFGKKSLATGINEPVVVGWILQTDHAQFVWNEPRPLKRITAGTIHAKAVAQCPAVNDYEARLIEIPCPFDLRLKLQHRGDGAHRVFDASGISSGMTPKVFSSLIQESHPSQWRDPSRPVFQILTPYTFIADEPVYVNLANEEQVPARKT